MRPYTAVAVGTAVFDHVGNGLLDGGVISSWGGTFLSMSIRTGDLFRPTHILTLTRRCAPVVDLSKVGNQRLAQLTQMLGVDAVAGSFM